MVYKQSNGLKTEWPITYGTVNSKGEDQGVLKLTDIETMYHKTALGLHSKEYLPHICVYIYNRLDHLSH